MWNELAVLLGKHSKVNMSFKRKVNHAHPEEARSSGPHIIILSLFCTMTSMVRHPTTRLLYTVRERMGLELSKWTQWECGMRSFAMYMLSWSVSYCLLMWCHCKTLTAAHRNGGRSHKSGFPFSNPLKEVYVYIFPHVNAYATHQCCDNKEITLHWEWRKNY